MTRALHIFEKDIRHLWPMILAVVSLQALLATVTIHGLNTSRWESGWEVVPALFRLILPFGWAFLLAQAVLQDPPSGENSFWLTRPYTWQPLLTSKLLFALVFLQLPLLISDVVILQLMGLPLNVPALLLRQLPFLALLTLPAVALSSLSRSIPQFCLLLIGLVLACILINVWVFDAPSTPWTRHSDVPVLLTASGLLLLAIALQFTRRISFSSRLLMPVLALVISGLLGSTGLLEHGLTIRDENPPSWPALSSQLDPLVKMDAAKGVVLEILSVKDLQPGLMLRGDGTAQIKPPSKTAELFLTDSLLSIEPVNKTALAGKRISVRGSLDVWVLNDKPTYQKTLTGPMRLNIPGVGLCAYGIETSWRERVSRLACWTGPVRSDAQLEMKPCHVNNLKIGDNAFRNNQIIFDFVPVDRVSSYGPYSPEAELTVIRHFSIAHFPLTISADQYILVPSP